MSESKFKTLRHIETVRNYLNAIIVELIKRGELHDRTKLESPEVEIFEEYTDKLKDIEYNSKEYKQCLEEMKPAIQHHHKYNRHHPEFHKDGIKGMNLIDLLEMIADWKASTMRMNKGDIHKSIEINQKRFGYSDEVTTILRNTVDVLEQMGIFHKAQES